MSHDGPYALSDVDQNREYFNAAIKRAALPIHVSFDPDCETLFVGRCVDSVFCIAAGGVYLDSAEATAAYFDLVATLSPAPLPLCAEPAGPSGSALSLQSAAELIPPSAVAPVVAAPPGDGRPLSSVAP